MMEKAVADLLAREAIRDLPLRYCDFVWRDDIPGLVDLFTENGTFTIIFNGEETSTVGRKDLLEFYSNATDFMPRPFIHNHVVDLSADGFAKGRCYLDLRSARSNMDWVGTGYYDDEYMATADGWKFHSRRFHALRMDELPSAIKRGDD